MTTSPQYMLITPHNPEISTFLPLFEKALATKMFSAVLIDINKIDPTEEQKDAQTLIQRAQHYECAAILRKKASLAHRLKADGIHSDEGVNQIEHILETKEKTMMLGAAMIKNRHDAMLMGEMGCDYLFFGMLDQKPKTHPHEKTLKLCAWWAELFETPCIGLAGTDLAALPSLIETECDFIALREALWEHPQGLEKALKALQKIHDDDKTH